MLFEVTFSDGTTRIMQAHNKKQLTVALQGVAFTKAEQKRRCKACRKAVATVQHTLCATCYAEALTACREASHGLPVTEEELESFALSFFVEG